MSLRAFAKKQRLRLVTDGEDDTPVIRGRDGHLYEYDDDRLGMMYMSPDGTQKKWGNIRRAAEASGMTLIQDGDSEGCLTFDASNHIQVQLAIRMAGVKAKRVLSDELREAVANRLSAYRAGLTPPKMASGRTEETALAA